MSRRFYKKKVIILLDEYDTPLQEAYVYGYWEELTGFIRSLFNSTFKTNPYIERGLLTGITRVSKESIFSDLNNLEVVTTTSEKYSSSFGFTEREVFEALDSAGLSDEKEHIRYWYDGFSFGSRKIKLADVQQVAQISAEDARKCCIELMKLGLIEIIGREYMLTARVYEAVKSDIEYTRDKTVQYIKAKDMIIEYIKIQGYISRSIVQELCGFTDQQARRTIEKMKKENIIQMSNGGRYAKYVLKEI